MFSDFEEIEKNYAQIEALLSDPEVLKDLKVYRDTARRHNELGKVVAAWRRLKKIQTELVGARVMLAESNLELRELAQSEMEILTGAETVAEEALKLLLLPKDLNDEKNTVVEIRAGTGGDEAALFAADLFRMYSRYAEIQGWRVEILSSNQTDGGGFKEIIALIEGERVYSQLKYESGVHRVQRVPATETQGRIHTSAVTVAVLPEAEEVEVDIRSEDVKVDVYRSSGPGGQSVNTTDSAVRVTHLPTGLVVICQDEKSQIKNKAKALRVLRARLLDQMVAAQQSRISEERRDQVGSGDRSERIRTYNFPQGRLTDHRVNLTLYRLNEVMDGDLAETIATIGAHFKARQLAGVHKNV
ncbi:MAG: peptide chain release factor 1 [Candidatus Adiutrix intracellularis]|jgi:peptide chain release factor 1|nr:peptide chain release factor 1 [Candidatus Adiutrix intracellularis]